MRLSLLLFLHSLLLPLSGRDVTPDDVTPPAESQLEILRVEVKKLRRSFLRFKRGGGRGKGKLCDEATGRINDAISMELSGLRSQLHVSDSIKSLRSELEYGLASVRSELENKVTSVRAELETGMTSVRSEVQTSGCWGQYRGVGRLNVRPCQGQREQHQTAQHLTGNMWSLECTIGGAGYNT
ncbi:hypothetical protein ACOMHN_030310 [Nucella lapillus]